MESFIRSPDPLKDKSPKTWVIWKEEFLIFMDLLGYMNRPQSFKANLFKNLIGSVGLQIINELSFERIEDKDNLDILIKKLDHYFYPQQTEAQIRYTFFNSVKKCDETMENYIQNLKERAKDCNFGNLTDSLIRDVVILNTHDKILRQKYLQEETLNNEKIVKIYNNHKIQDHGSKAKSSNIKPKDSKEEKKNKEVLKETKHVNAMPMQRNCWRCNTKHEMKKCPAWNYKCTKCNTLHHFEQCCKGPCQNTARSINMNNLDINKDQHVKETKPFYNIHKH